MTLRKFASVGSPLLLALTIVSAVSLSARLYKEDLDSQKALAASVQTSAIAWAFDNLQ